jgi:hypothetical protein
VRLKVPTNTSDRVHVCSDAKSQVCAMTRDVCIVAQHGCVAEAGEESRLDRVKAVLARFLCVVVHFAGTRFSFAFFSCSCISDRDRDLSTCARAMFKVGSVFQPLPVLLFLLFEHQTLTSFCRI